LSKKGEKRGGGTIDKVQVNENIPWGRLRKNVKVLSGYLTGGLGGEEQTTEEAN